jgi:hypothetical protein
MSKDLYVEAHEELVAEYLEQHPGRFRIPRL